MLNRVPEPRECAVVKEGGLERRVPERRAAKLVAIRRIPRDLLQAEIFVLPRAVKDHVAISNPEVGRRNLEILASATLEASLLQEKVAAPEKGLAMISVLFNSQDKWAVHDPIPPLLQIAKQAGFTQATFDECLKDQKLYEAILAMRERASKDYKVESTPTLFINGKVQKGGASI